MFYESLLNEEEKAIQREVRKFVRDEVSHDFIRALDRDEIKYPREYVEKLAAHNLLGLRFDPKWGGRGLPWTSEVLAIEEIGVLGTTLGCAFVMPSIVGEALHLFGTDEQKEHFLRPILQGKLISAEALTEPRGGSDFFGATTRAVLEDDHFIVNGQKRFVVGATEADVFLVYCLTNFDENAHKYQRISAILVERGPGVETEYNYGLLGTRGGGTGRLVFRNVRVPKENLIGVLHGGALVFNQMMIPERLTSAAASLGRAGGLGCSGSLQRQAPCLRPAYSSDFRQSISWLPTPLPIWMQLGHWCTWLPGPWILGLPTFEESSAKPNDMPPIQLGKSPTKPCR